MSCVDMVNGITQHSPLQMSAALHRWKQSCQLANVLADFLKSRSLLLGGARPTDIRNIFGPLFRCSDTLRELEFHGANGSFTMSHIHIIVAACPTLVALGLKGRWTLEAVSLPC